MMEGNHKIKKMEKLHKIIKITLVVLIILASATSVGTIVSFVWFGLETETTDYQENNNSSLSAGFLAFGTVGNFFCCTSSFFIAIIVLVVFLILKSKISKEKEKLQIENERYYKMQEENRLHNERLELIKIEKAEKEKIMKAERKRRKEQELEDLKAQTKKQQEEEEKRRKEEEKRRAEEEIRRQNEERKRQEEENRRKEEEIKRKEEEKRRRIIEEKQAHNFETAHRYEDAILVYEKLELWEDAGRCRKLLREMKLEELKAQQATIDIGSIGTTIQDSVLNRSDVGSKKKD